MRARTLALVAAACLLAACGPKDFSLDVAHTTTTSAAVATTSTTMAAPAPAPSTTVPGPVTTAAPAPSSTARAAPPTTAAPAPATTAAQVPVDPQLNRVGSAQQAIVVTAPSYGATSATLTAYDRTPSGWQVAYGPWTARVGYSGIAPPGEKSEGDGRTPSGVYGFQFMFGVAADPGVQFPYRVIPDRSIVWVDDPQSALYNQWVDLDEQPGVKGEAMYQPVAYQHGAVIAYNTARTPGAGSAIFLHASTGGSTAGCVSLPVSQLVQVLRWLDPAKSPRIVLGAG